LVPLIAEAVNAALEVDPERARAILDRLPADVSSDPRIQLAQVRYLLDLGDAAGAEKLLDGGIELAGVREGANPLAEYWQRAQELLGTNRPVPAQYEFGMFGDR